MEYEIGHQILKGVCPNCKTPTLQADQEGTKNCAKCGFKSNKVSQQSWQDLLNQALK